MIQEAPKVGGLKEAAGIIVDSVVGTINPSAKRGSNYLTCEQLVSFMSKRVICGESHGPKAVDLVHALKSLSGATCANSRNCFEKFDRFSVYALQSYNMQLITKRSNGLDTMLINIKYKPVISKRKQHFVCPGLLVCTILDYPVCFPCIGTIVSLYTELIGSVILSCCHLLKSSLTSTDHNGQVTGMIFNAFAFSSCAPDYVLVTNSAHKNGNLIASSMESLCSAMFSHGCYWI